MKRSNGERTRARHHLANLRAMLDSIDLTLRSTDLPGSDQQQAVIIGAYNLASSVSRVDAYMRAEHDAEPPVCKRCRDTHEMTLGESAVMCTACPTPCQKCRDGAFCKRTPCSCLCHQKKGGK